MATKRSVQLFGDNGANGTRSPIEETAPPGMGTHNRAVAYGEALTSARANRIAYALALNDDDLDDRIDVFETGGLDAAYRLGINNTAGGGRVVDINGGALEARSARTESYADDPANACFRAALDTDTVAGGVGFDALLRAGAAADPVEAPGTFGFLDRRLMVFDSDLTKVPELADGLLNGGGANSDGVTIVMSGKYFSQSDMDGITTDLLFGHDLIELLDSPYKGLYRIAGGPFLESGTVLIERLDGGTPEFPPDTSVSFRVFRPVFASGQVKGRGGVSIAALPTEDHSGDTLHLEQPDPAAKLIMSRGMEGRRLFDVDGVGDGWMNRLTTGDYIRAGAYVEAPVGHFSQLGVSLGVPVNLNVWNVPTFRQPATFKENITGEKDVIGATFKYGTLKTILHQPIPLTLCSTIGLSAPNFGDSTFLRDWYRPASGVWQLVAPAPSNAQVRFPLTGFVPYGAEILDISIRYKTAGFADGPLKLKIYREASIAMDQLTSSSGSVALTTLWDTNVPPHELSTYRLLTTTPASPIAAPRLGGPVYGAVEHSFGMTGSILLSHIYVSYRYLGIDD